jgi:hypothetical protein
VSGHGLDPFDDHLQFLGMRLGGCVVLLPARFGIILAVGELAVS